MRAEEQPAPLAALGSDEGRLLQAVRRLEMAAWRRASGLLGGVYQSAVPGRGMIFHEARKYVSGEPARSIDWNVSARLGEPYVKVHLEERQQEVFVVLDVSPSMHAGWQAKTKLELAVELAATLAVSVIAAGDRLGYVIFADRVIAEGRPRGGRPQLFRVLRAILEHVGSWTRPVEVSDPRSAIHALERYRKGRYAIFLISDFIDHDLPDDLKYVRARHDVSLLHIYDPVEFAAPRAIRFLGYSPEGRDAGEGMPGEGDGLVEMQDFLREKSAEHRMTFESFSTASEVGGTLRRLLHHAQRRRG